MDIIQTICNDKRYFSICKKISREHCLDLYQETMLQVCLPETKDRLEKANDERRLETYVTGIIYNLWAHRKRPNDNLYRITDNLEMWQDYKAVTKSHNDQRLTIKKAVNELSKKIKSKEKEESEGAKLLWKVSQSNAHVVSKEQNTSFYQIKRKITPIIIDIKRKLDE